MKASGRVNCGFQVNQTDAEREKNDLWAVF
jgi:hypothetical protein